MTAGLAIVRGADRLYGDEVRQAALRAGAGVVVKVVE
jgi:hypothetical protein